jgi:hypothetical protein
LALPGVALGQATRTWVSGVGDDANPCSRTAPCKTFAGAISKTAPGGEIDALDSGGFGALTITKSITINGEGAYASVLVSNTNGIVVAAAATDHVVINDIHFQGLASGGSNAGLNAVRFISGASLLVENSEINNFGQNGIDFESNTPGATLNVFDTRIHDNTGNGVLIAPGAGASHKVFLNNDDIDGNGCGIVATSFGMPGSPNFSTNCGTQDAGPTAGGAKINASNSSMSNNAGAGVYANGSPAIDYLSADVVTGNGTGLLERNGGQIIEIGGNNSVFGNTSDGSPTSIVGTGATGPRGPAGEVELIKCHTVIKHVKVHGKKRKRKVQKCTGKLVSGPVKFTVTGRAARATLARDGNVYAVGTMAVGSNGGEAILSPRRHLRAGRYTMTLRRGRRIVGRRTVDVR